MQDYAVSEGPRAPRPRDVDAYIDSAAEWSAGILTFLRQLIHRTIPGVSEAIKWGGPCFEHGGLVCGLGAFKHFVTLHFFRGAELSDLHGVFNAGEGNTQSRSVKIAPDADIPAEGIADLLRQAAALNGLAIPRPKSAPKPPPEMHPEFAAALKKNRLAAKNLEAMTPGCQREYLQWINQAKRDETRQKRIAESLAKLEQGRRAWDQYKR